MAAAPRYVHLPALDQAAAVAMQDMQLAVTTKAVLQSTFARQQMAGVHSTACTLVLVIVRVLATLATLSMVTTRAAQRSTTAPQLMAAVTKHAAIQDLRLACAHAISAIR